MWLLAGLCLVLGCQAEKAPNELVVIVDSDMRIGSDLKSIDVEISDRSLDAGVLSSNHFELVADNGASPPVGQFTLPLSFVIAPLSQQSSRDFRLVVSGRDLSGAEAVVEQQLISSFRPDYSGRLVVFLAQRCMQQLCFKDGKRSTETCNPATGICEETPVVTAERADIDDKLGGYQRPDAAAVGADAAQLPDSGNSTDASVPDTGTPPSTDAGSDAGNDAAAAPDARMPPPPPDTNIQMITPMGIRAVAAASASGRGAVAYLVAGASNDPQIVRYDVYARIYETDTGWGPPFLLSASRPQDVFDSFVDAVMDADGNLTVTWRRLYALYARRNVASKRSWEAEVNVRDGDVNYSNDYSMIVDALGNVMVSAPKMNDFGTMRWEASTGAWNTIYGRINDDSTIGYYYPQLTSDLAGNVTAAWQDQNNRVIANRFDVTTNPPGWGKPVVVRSTAVQDFTVGEVSVAARNDGSVLVMWTEFQPSSYMYFVGANMWDPQLKAWRVTTPDASIQRIAQGRLSAIAGDPTANGAFFAFWEGRMHSYDGNTTYGFNPAVPVGRDGSINLLEQRSLMMGVDAHGTRFAAWPQIVPNGVDIAYSWAARPSGTEVWADITAIGAKVPSWDNLFHYDIGFPSMSIGAPGRALIAWNQPLTGDANPPTSVNARWVTFGP